MAHPLVEAKDFGYQLLKKYLDSSKTEKVWQKKFLGAYKGDYWQTGKGYLGPPPKPGDKDSQLLWTTFQDRFVSRNVIGEVVARVSNAFLGKSPDWKYVVDGKQIKRRTSRGTNTPVPQNDEESPITGNKEAETVVDEMDMVLGEYYTTEGLASKMIECFDKRLVSERCSLRVYIPSKFRDADGLVKADTIADAFKRIKVEVIEPDKARTIETDGETIGIVTYKVVKDWNTGQTEDVIEFSFVDDAKETFIGVFQNQGDQGLAAAQVSGSLPLDEQLVHYEMKGEAYVTEQLWRCNALLNLSLTMAGFGLVESGFAEMVLTNVELETVEVDDPTAEGGKATVPKSIKRGGGATQNFVGMETVNYETGERTLHTPGVHYKDPSPMDTYKDGKDLGYETCLEEAGQKYALISADATTTGESRIQAMGDFYLKIKKYKAEVDKMGSWLLTVVMRLASLIADKESDFAKTSILFDSKIRISSLTADEKRIVLEQQKAGIISLETARVLLEVEDPILEEELVAKDQAQALERSVEQIKATAAASPQPTTGDPNQPPSNKPKKQPAPSAGGNPS